MLTHNVAAAVAAIFARFEADRSRYRHAAAIGEFAGPLKAACHVSIHFARDGRATIQAGDKYREPGTPGALRVLKLDHWPTPAEAVDALADHFAELRAAAAAQRAERRESLAEFWGHHTSGRAAELLAQFDADALQLA